MNVSDVQFWGGIATIVGAIVGLYFYHRAEARAQKKALEEFELNLGQRIEVAVDHRVTSVLLANFNTLAEHERRVGSQHLNLVSEHRDLAENLQSIQEQYAALKSMPLPEVLEASGTNTKTSDPDLLTNLRYGISANFGAVSSITGLLPSLFMLADLKSRAYAARANLPHGSQDRQEVEEIILDLSKSQEFRLDLLNQLRRSAKQGSTASRPSEQNGAPDPETKGT